RFDARNSAVPTGRGYGAQAYHFPVGGGRSFYSAFTFAEMIPERTNRVTLDPHRKDAWGIPVLRIDCRYNERQFALARDQYQALRDIAKLIGVSVHRLDDAPHPPGNAVHEC